MFDAFSGLSKTKNAKTAQQRDDVLLQPKVLGWAWERGIRVGLGRKPDAYLFTEEQLHQYNPDEFIIVMANSPWVGSTGGPQRR